ncbi:MAG: hypothetical protein H6765_11535 [Candidatus Peribacteria bacterium]|nr:MAG: hypothetical protein H6765_11535 [Candidatus Peribacteria bacterium]
MYHLQLLHEYVDELMVHVAVAEDEQQTDEDAVDDVDDLRLKLNLQVVDADDNLFTNDLL